MTNYGVKLCVIDEMDYNSIKEIADAIQKLGYKINVIDNGNFVCTKEVNREIQG